MKGKEGVDEDGPGSTGPLNSRRSEGVVIASEKKRRDAPRDKYRKVKTLNS